MGPVPNNALLTLKELADRLKVPVKTIYHWVHRREVPYLKVGRHLRFDEDAVLAHFRERTAHQTLSCPTYADLVESRRRSLKTR